MAFDLTRPTSASADEWRRRYDAQTDVPAGTKVTITATATDRPGYKGALSVEVTTPWRPSAGVGACGPGLGFLPGTPP